MLNRRDQEFKIIDLKPFANLEHVDAALRDHGDSEDEHEEDHDGGELESARAQDLGPVVDDAGDEGLEDAELRVEPEGQQHQEEEDRPGGSLLGSMLRHLEMLV